MEASQHARVRTRRAHAHTDGTCRHMCAGEECAQVRMRVHCACAFGCAQGRASVRVCVPKPPTQGLSFHTLSPRLPLLSPTLLPHPSRLGHTCTALRFLASSISASRALRRSISSSAAFACSSANLRSFSCLSRILEKSVPYHIYYMSLSGQLLRIFATRTPHLHETPLQTARRRHVSAHAARLPRPRDASQLR